jgi:hypothetical protein
LSILCGAGQKQGFQGRQAALETLLLPYLGLATAISRFHLLSRISPERGFPKATF